MSVASLFRPLHAFALHTTPATVAVVLGTDTRTNMAAELVMTIGQYIVVPVCIAAVSIYFIYSVFKDM